MGGVAGVTFHVEKFNGEPIAKAGLYSGVPSGVYHGANLCAGPSISSTGLRTIFAKSPAHYWCTSPYNPSRIEQEDNDAMALGRATHHLLLGEANFAKHYAIRPDKIDGEDWHHARKSCKAWLKTMADEGRAVLTKTQAEAIIGMRNGLREHPLIRDDGILNGLIEHTLVWQDAETGVWLKSRPDVIPLASDDGVDLKTASDVSEPAIEHAIGAYGLNMQGALVRAAWREVFKRDLQGFSLVFVESKPPHCAEVVTLKPHDLETGERQNRAALALFVKCMNEGRWPGPGGTQTDAKFIEIKPWHRTQIENRLSAIEMELAA